MPVSNIDQLGWISDLYALSQTAALQEDVHNLGQRMLRPVIQGFDADGGYLALTDPDDGMLRVVAVQDIPQLVPGARIAIKPADTDTTPVSSTLFESDDLGFYLPLITDAGVIGALRVHRSAERESFRADELDRGSTMAALLTLVLDNRRMHVEQHKQIEYLSRSNAEICAINQRLEEVHHQLLQSEKMASIGQLAAGVAHEINNPIGYVHSNLGTLETYVDDVFRVLDMYAQIEQEATPRDLFDKVKALRGKLDIEFLRSDTQALLAETREGIGRVRKIVQDLKDFSHVGSEDEWTFADLHKGLDSTLNIVANEIKYKAQVIKDYAELPEIRCQPSQLNQIFLNLLVNAAHAIESNGTISITTRCDAEAVRITIADTGSGISPEHLPRIFDPFFTTKPVGKGTGLGLSLSYGIAQKHGGRIEVESEIGKGTRFCVVLPRERSVEQKVQAEVQHG